MHPYRRPTRALARIAAVMLAFVAATSVIARAGPRLGPGGMPADLPGCVGKFLTEGTSGSREARSDPLNLRIDGVPEAPSAPFRSLPRAGAPSGPAPLGDSDMSAAARTWSRFAVRTALAAAAGVGLLGVDVARGSDVAPPPSLTSVAERCRLLADSIEDARTRLGAGEPDGAALLLGPLQALRGARGEAISAAIAAEDRRLGRSLRRLLGGATMTVGRAFRRSGSAYSGLCLRALGRAETRVLRAAVLLQEAGEDAGGVQHAEPDVAGAVPPPKEGPGFVWTALTPSADSRVVYVSSSAGDDSNDGTSRETPVKTLKRAQSLTRASYPDWILLKRGDTWTGEWFEAIAGRSKAEPSVVWSYGESASRPKLVNGGYYAPGARSNVDHIAVLGLEMRRTDPAFDWCGIAIESGSKDVLIEDCYVSGFRLNVLAASIDHSLADVRLRGCVIVDAHPDPNAPHSSGFLAHAVDGLLIEGCLFDHNGWDYSSNAASTQNHNVYLMPDTCKNVVVRNNVFARGSSHGIAQGCGGVNEDNLYLQNAIGMWYRGAGAIRRNVILDGRDVGPDDARGWGIDVSDANGLEVAENVIAHQQSGTNAIAMKFDRAMTDTKVHDNVVYGWTGPWGGYALMNNATSTGGNRIYSNTFVQPKRYLVYCEADVDPAKLQYADNTYNCADDASKWFEAFFYQCGFDVWVEKSHETGAKTETVSFSDKSRTISTYAESQGLAGSLDAFLAAARKQSRADWSSTLSAHDVNAWVREGFTVSAK